MSKFYEPVENGGDIASDSDFRIAIARKIQRALDLFLTIARNNIELHNTFTFTYGEETYNAYPDKESLMNYWITYEAYTGLIINNLCVLLGDRKNDKLSILKAKEEYDTVIIDEFYCKNQKQLKSLFTARDKMYAHIDADLDGNAFEYSIDFLGECVSFLETLFRGGKK